MRISPRQKYVLSKRLIPELRKPAGELFKGPVEVGIGKLRELLSRIGPVPKLIAVGDVVTGGMKKLGVKADLYIVDNKVMRKPIKPIRLKVDRTIKVSNPRGTITGEAWLTIEEALRSSARIKIFVDGEEDLLALPATLLSPENSIVIYGQPNEGVVVIRVKKGKKAELRRILEAMEIVEE